MRRALPFLALAALLVVLVIGLTQAGGGDDGEPASSPSPAQARQALERAPGPLGALYDRANRVERANPETFVRELRRLRGYPVVVNAWATWCGPCKLEFPFFQRVATRRGLEVAFVGLNVQDNLDSAEDFLRERPVPYPSFEDGGGDILREVAPGVRGLPVTIFYDAKGEQTFVHQGGYRNEEQLLADVNRYAGA